MQQRGKVVYAKGKFSVVELLETYLDGTKEIIGFVVTGPGADSTWIYGDIGQAIALADELDDSYRPQPSRGMGM